MKGLPRKFSSVKPVNRSVNTCEHSAALQSVDPGPELPVRECDLEAVRVVIKRGSVTRDFIVPVRQGEAAGSTIIDVLASPLRAVKGSMPRDTSTIEFTISQYATCSGSKHPLLSLTPGHASDPECSPVNSVKASHSMPVYRTLRPWEAGLVSGERFKLFNLLLWFWGAIADDQLGNIQAVVETCGVRKVGDIVGPVELPIRVYPIESYSITLSIPPLWSRKREESNELKISGGAQNSDMVDKNQWRREVSASRTDKFAFSDKSSSSRSTTTQERKMFGKDVSIEQKHYEWAADGSVASTDRTSLDGQMGVLDFSRKADDDKKPWEKVGIKLDIKRDGSSLDFEVGEFLTCVTRAAKALKDFR